MGDVFESTTGPARLVVQVKHDLDRGVVVLIHNNGSTEIDGLDVPIRIRRHIRVVDHDAPELVWRTG